MCPSCDSPYISLPMFHQTTLYGSGCPFAARSLPIGVSVEPFMYCTHSAAECASPKPEFTQMYGSIFSRPQSFMNSSEPTSLYSTVT